ncbi:MAG: alkaline phosphatase D family protein [Myxococcales bacterium]|nr:alkaline phosphatase D family protein [Myxococcales bacterium]
MLGDRWVRTSELRRAPGRTLIALFSVLAACAEDGAPGHAFVATLDLPAPGGDAQADGGVTDDAVDTEPADAFGLDVPVFTLDTGADVGAVIDATPSTDVVPTDASPNDVSDTSDVDGNDVVDDPCGDWSWSVPTAATTDGTTDDFPWGVTAGSIEVDRARVWTRLASPGTVDVRLSSGPGCEVVVGSAAASLSSGGIVQADFQGLDAGRVYRYRFVLESGDSSSYGWFRTPSTDDVPFVVAMAGDIDAEQPTADAMIVPLLTSGAERLLWLGDWPYSDKGIPAKTLAEYRAKHAAARAVPAVPDLLRFMPIEAQWDDHEIINDWDGADSAFDPARVGAGKQAYVEWFPIVGAETGEIYRRYRLGPQVDVFQLDCRSHRDANDAPNDAQKTMLGDEQLAWLLDGLSSSTAAFKLVLTSVPLDYGTTTNDHWPGFGVERDAILSHIVENGEIGGVVFITADQHWLSVHDLPAGMKEWQVGPAGTHFRKPDPQPPEVLFQLEVLNAGLLAYEPSPPRLTFTAIDDAGEPIYAETLQAGRGQIIVTPDSPSQSWWLSGAHQFSGTGPKTLSYAPPGPYTVIWGPAPGQSSAPPETLVLTDGASITFAPADDAPLLFEDFAAGVIPGNWAIVNQGVEDASPAWAVSAGSIRETGNAYDVNQSEEVVEKRGTFLWTSVNADDAAVIASVYAGDNDGFGLMYAINGTGASYYRASFDIERSFARLVRVDGDTFTVLAENLDYLPAQGTWTQVAVERIGATHRVIVDGQVVLEAEDGALGAGGVGLYAWGMSDVRFDDVGVFELTPP